MSVGMSAQPRSHGSGKVSFTGLAAHRETGGRAQRRAVVSACKDCVMSIAPIHDAPRAAETLRPATRAMMAAAALVAVAAAFVATGAVAHDVAAQTTLLSPQR